MKKWLTRNRETVMPLAVVIIVCLLMGNLIKHHLLRSSSLASNKDALAAAQSILNIVLLICGAILSYYRFFRGRTFTTRAELAITVAVFSANDKCNMHFVELTVKNIGTSALWEPEPSIRVRYFDSENTPNTTWNDWGEAASPFEEQNTLAVIDSGEAASFVAYHMVKKGIWAVEYTAFVRSDTGEIWKKSQVAPNVTPVK